MTTSTPSSAAQTGAAAATTPGPLPGGLTIRVAALDDAAMLARLQVEMDDGDVAHVDANAIARMHGTLSEMSRYPDFRAYLVLRENEPVASFSLMIFGGPSHGGAAQALLDAVVVRRDCRGSGIGDAMLQHALDLARAAGCYKLMLSSNLKRIDAHRFYQRAGFVQHGISLAIDLPR